MRVGLVEPTHDGQGFVGGAIVHEYVFNGLARIRGKIGFHCAQSVIKVRKGFRLVVAGDDDGKVHGLSFFMKCRRAAGAARLMVPVCGGRLLLQGGLEGGQQVVERLVGRQVGVVGHDLLG